MKALCMRLLLPIILFSNFAFAGGYTEHKYTVNVCKAFADEAAHYSTGVRHAYPYSKLKKNIDISNDAPVKKDRQKQAVDLVYFNKLDNPTLAYSTALSNCLKPQYESKIKNNASDSNIRNGLMH